MARALLLIIISVVLSVGASLAAMRWGKDYIEMPIAELKKKSRATEPKAAPLPETPRVVALGTLQPEGGVIQVSGPAGERISQIKVAEGDDVQAGEVLAVLESHSLRNLEKTAAERQLAEAVSQKPIELALGNAQIAEAEVNVKQVALRQAGIATQEEKVKALKANLEFARQDLNRLEGLDETIVSTQQRQKQALAVDQAETEWKAAEQMLDTMKQNRQYEANLAQAKLDAAKATRDRMVAALQIESLKSSVELANGKLSMSQVQAPVDGRIFKVLMQPGETTGQIPILRMGNVEKMFAVAEVYETDIGRVQIGQQATITGDALIDPQTHAKYTMSGVVDRIGTMVSSNEVRSLDPTDRGDLRVVDVRVLIDKTFREAASRLINLQVTVQIKTPSAGHGPGAREPATAAQAQR